MRKNKGITIVALVVTIIALIIIAGISINLLLGENGILTKAKEAKKAQKVAEVKEKLSLEIAAAETDAIIRDENLEQRQLEDIINKYGTLQEDGDTILTKEDNYELSLKEIWYGVLSTSGSYSDEVEQVEMLEKELGDLKKKYEDLENLNQGNSKLLEDLQKQIEDLEKEKQTLENELQEERNKNQGLEEELQLAQSQNQESQNKLQEEQNKSKSLEEQLQSAQSKNQESENKLQEEQSKNQSLQKQLDDLNSTLETQQSEFMQGNNFVIISKNTGATGGTNHGTFETKSYAITQTDYDTYKAYLVTLNVAGCTNVSWGQMEPLNSNPKILSRLRSTGKGTTEPDYECSCLSYCLFYSSLPVGQSISFKVAGVYNYSIIGIK